MSEIDWTDDIPRSRRFGDVYFSRAGGLAETEAVFLRPNRLTERLAGGGRVVIGELGFGTGLNFLAAWQLWRDGGHRGRLYMISLEAFLPLPAELAAAHGAFPELADISRQLRQALPPMASGCHRLSFENDQVVLLLLLGDAATMLRQLDARVDAWFLDGFSPACNPDMWSEAVFAQVARLSGPGTTASTWCAAGAARRSLSAAGFRVERVPGHGRKRHRTEAVFTGAASHTASTPWELWPQEPAAAPVHILGAGLAGSALAASLAKRGRLVTVHEAAREAAAGASGNRSGLVLPRLSRQPTPLSDWQLPACLLAMRLLPDAAVPVRLGNEARAEAAAMTAALNLLPDFFRTDADGALITTGLCVNPAELCRRWLSGIDCRFNESRDPETLEGIVIDCRGPATAGVPLRAVRGQLSHLNGPTPALAWSDRHYLIPAAGGAVLGATFQPDDPEPSWRTADHDALVTDFTAQFGSAPLAGFTVDGGRTAFRACTVDYLPAVGPLPDTSQWLRDYGPAIRHGRPTASLPPAAWLPGRYTSAGHGAHGIAGSLLAAELLTAHLCGDPIPILRPLRSAVQPARFLLRQLRQSPSASLPEQAG